MKLKGQQRVRYSWVRWHFSRRPLRTWMTWPERLKFSKRLYPFLPRLQYYCCLKHPPTPSSSRPMQAPQPATQGPGLRPHQPAHLRLIALHTFCACPGHQPPRPPSTAHSQALCPLSPALGMSLPQVLFYQEGFSHLLPPQLERTFPAWRPCLPGGPGNV